MKARQKENDTENLKFPSDFETVGFECVTVASLASAPRPGIEFRLRCSSSPLQHQSFFAKFRNIHNKVSK